MLVTKALPQDVALLAFVLKSQASVLLSLRFRRKINFAIPAGVALHSNQFLKVSVSFLPFPIKLLILFDSLF